MSAATSLVVWPAVDPHVTEEAGTRGGTHAGVDLAALLDDPVLAAFDGEVVFVGGDGARGRIWLGDRWLYPNGEGKTVDIRRDDGLISRVGHLNGYATSVGARVTAGQCIGYAGTTGYSTGVHIHWETRWDRAWSGGRWINPRTLNPVTFGGAQSLLLQEEDDMDSMFAIVDGVPSWCFLNWSNGRIYAVHTQAEADWIGAYMGSVKMDLSRAVYNGQAVTDGGSALYKSKLALFGQLAPKVEIVGGSLTDADLARLREQVQAGVTGALAGLTLKAEVNG